MLLPLQPSFIELKRAMMTTAAAIPRKTPSKKMMSAAIGVRNNSNVSVQIQMKT